MHELDCPGRQAGKFLGCVCLAHVYLRKVSLQVSVPSSIAQGEIWGVSYNGNIKFIQISPWFGVWAKNINFLKYKGAGLLNL